MGINGTQINASDVTPQTSGLIVCNDEAAFNMLLKGGAYWAQKYNMEGKKGTEYKTAFQGFLVRFFQPQVPARSAAFSVFTATL